MEWMSGMNREEELTGHDTDPLEFAYQARKRVEDVTATLLDFVVGHLEGKKTHVCLCFVDFS